MAEPQGAFLGSAYGYIDIDSSAAIASLNQTKTIFNNFITDTGAMLQNFGGALAGWGQSLTMFMLPLAAAGGAGLKVASDFDSVLTEIQARTGLTTEAMEQIRQAALDAGAATSFSSQQAADAFLNLLTAGLSVEEALATLGPVLDAAAAGNMDLARAADYTTSIVAAYNLSAQDSTKIVNALAQAAGASPASMDEMGAALLRASASATRFGLDVTETSAILAIFAKNGLRGEEAGTQLNSMLRNMTSSAIPTQQVWKELGISLYDAQGQARDLDAVFGDLRLALDGMADEDRNRIIQQLAGSEGMLAFNALLAGQSIASMTDEMNAQASANEVAAKMMASFAGMVDSLKGSIETLWITVLTPFMNNVLRPLLGGADGTGGLIGIVNAVTAWAAANEPLVQTIVTLTTGFLALGPTAWGLGEAIKFIGFNLSTLGTIFSFMMSPLGLFIGAVGLLAFIFRDQLAAGLQIAGYAFAGFQAMFAETGDFLGSAISGINDFILRFAITLGMPTAAAAQMVGGVNRAFQAIRSAIGTFFTWITTAWNSFQSGGFAGLGTFLYDSFMSVDWVQLGLDIISAIGSGLSIAGSWVSDNLITPLTGAFSAVDWGAVGNSILQGIGLAISLYTGWINFVTDNILTPLFDNAKTALSTINWQQLGHDITSLIFSPQGGAGDGSLFSAFLNTFLVGFDFLSWATQNVVLPFFQGVLDGLPQVDWGQVWTSFLDLAGQALNTLWAAATWAWDNFISPMINAAGLALSQVDWMQLGTDILNALGTGLMALWSAATWAYDNLIQPLFDNAKLAIESIDWFEVGQNIVNAIGSALQTTFDFVAWLVNSIFNPMVATPGAATEQVDWSGMAMSIFTAIQNAVWAVISFVDWLVETIFLPLATGASQAINDTDWSAIGQDFMDSIADSLPNMQQWVQDWVIGPITAALAGFNPMAGIALSPTVSPSTTGASGGGGNWLGQVIGGLIPGAGGLFGSYASGIDYVPSDMIALIHQGERIQRANENPYNPNAQATGMGKQFNFGDIIIENISASSPQEASMLGDAFSDAFMRRIKNSGVGEDI